MKKRYWMGAGIAFAVLFVAGIVLMSYMSSRTALLGSTEISTGQQNNVMAYDDANDIFFIGTRTGCVTAYENSTHKVLWQFQNESSQPITCIVTRSDSGLVYAGSDDRSVYTLNMSDGTVKNTLDVQRRVTDLDISQDGTLAALTTLTNNKSNVMVYDLTSGETIANTRYTYPQRAVRFAPGDEQLIIANERGQFKRVTFDCEEVANANVLQTRSVGIATNNNGQYMTADVHGNYVVVDENMNILRQGKASTIEGAIITACGIDDDGNIIIGTEQGYMYVLNKNDEQIYETRQVENRQVSAFVSDGSRMYITGYGDFVEYIELSSLETIAAFTTWSTVIMVGTILSAVLCAACLMWYFPSSNRGLRRVGKALWKHKLSYIALIPTFTLLILFNYTPMFVAMTRAFTNWSQENFTAADIDFVGFANFQRMFTEGYFLVGVKNMCILAITGFIKTFTMPLIAAWLVYSFKSSRQKYAFRFLFVLPIVVPGIVGTLMWKEIFNPGGGLDQFLNALGLGQFIHVWLGEEATAIWSIVFMGLPYIGAFPFLMYYGGFTSIDSNLYEAAKIDGASRGRIFWRIQLPMVMPQIKLLVMLQFIGSIQDYGGVYLLTGGGPGTATYVPGLELYYNATRFGNYGYACAMGLTMFVVIMIGTYFTNRIKAENYGS